MRRSDSPSLRRRLKGGWGAARPDCRVGRCGLPVWGCLRGLCGIMSDDTDHPDPDCWHREPGGLENGSQKSLIAGEIPKSTTADPVFSDLSGTTLPSLTGEFPETNKGTVKNGHGTARPVRYRNRDSDCQRVMTAAVVDGRRTEPFPGVGGVPRTDRTTAIGTRESHAMACR